MLFRSLPGQHGDDLRDLQHILRLVAPELDVNVPVVKLAALDVQDVGDQLDAPLQAALELPLLDGADLLQPPQLIGLLC